MLLQARYDGLYDWVTHWISVVVGSLTIAPIFAMRVLEEHVAWVLGCGAYIESFKSPPD